MARRYRKSTDNLFGTLILVVIIFGICSFVFQIIVSIWETTAGKAAFLASTFLGITYYLLKLKKEMNIEYELKEQIENVQVSHDRNDYIIENNDYRRGNKTENLYRKTLLLPLLQIYENKCAKCGRNDNGLELDHFFISKNEGGNFILKHQNGHLVNNAIPLCQTCNRSKSDKHFRSFFTNTELLQLFIKNVEMTRRLNEK